MKNIADVNSDDILTELNSLDYDENDDLKLLDDEDIKPIGNNNQSTDLSSFYSNYEKKTDKITTNSNLDLYTEKPKNEPTRVESINKPIEQPKINNTPVNKPSSTTNIDNYLNRAKETKLENNEYSSAYKSDLYSQNQKNVTPFQKQSQNQNVIQSVQSKPTYNSVNTSSTTSENNITDLNQLFSKVSNNVKGASEIVNKNVEIKRKIEDRFNELRRMQQEYEDNKKKDYDEINAYKDEVYTKLQQKRSDLEKDVNTLRMDQEKLEKEKKSFEEYKNISLSNLNKLEKELKDSYDNRNRNIEQVEKGLVKRKEQLDNERAMIAKEKEQIKKEREELAENLMKFNKLVSEFTSGIDNFG